MSIPLLLETGMEEEGREIAMSEKVRPSGDVSGPEEGREVRRLTSFDRIMHDGWQLTSYSFLTAVHVNNNLKPSNSTKVSTTLLYFSPHDTWPAYTYKHGACYMLLCMSMYV